MPDEAPETGGWLPPAAPDGSPPPRFDAPRWTPPDAVHAPSPQRVAPPPADRPTFVSRPPHERNGAAVWALVLGIAGLTLLLLSFGTLFFVTLPLSAAAWMLARRAQEAIAAGQVATGQGQAVAALWLGRAGVLAGVAAAVVLIALIASGFDFEEFRRDLERELDRQREQDGDGDGGDGVRTAIEALRAFIAR